MLGGLSSRAQRALYCYNISRLPTTCNIFRFANIFHDIFPHSPHHSQHIIHTLSSVCLHNIFFFRYTIFKISSPYLMWILTVFQKNKNKKHVLNVCLNEQHFHGDGTVLGYVSSLAKAM